MRHRFTPKQLTEKQSWQYITDNRLVIMMLQERISITTNKALIERLQKIEKCLIKNDIPHPIPKPKKDEFVVIAYDIKTKKVVKIIQPSQKDHATMLFNVIKKAKHPDLKNIEIVIEKEAKEIPFVEYKEIKY